MGDFLRGVWAGLRGIAIVLVAALVTVVIGGVAFLLVGGFFFDVLSEIPGGPGDRRHIVQYCVIGTAERAEITIRTHEGTEQHLVGVPYESPKYPFRRGQFAYISAQNHDGGGSIMVQLYVDARLAKSAGSGAEFGIAKVSGSVGLDP